MFSAITTSALPSSPFLKVVYVNNICLFTVTLLICKKKIYKNHCHISYTCLMLCTYVKTFYFLLSVYILGICNTYLTLYSMTSFFSIFTINFIVKKKGCKPSRTCTAHCEISAFFTGVNYAKPVRSSQGCRSR